jgi:hypothetical protein
MTDRFVYALSPGYADQVRLRSESFGWSEPERDLGSAHDAGSRLGDEPTVFPHLGTLRIPSSKLSGRRLRPGEGNDMHSNNGLSRKGRTG